MAKTGIYRSIYSRLPDTREFRKLSPDAKLLFYTMRISRVCNLPGIFHFEEGEIATIAIQSGLGSTRVGELLPELEAGGWIVYRSPLLWIVNALRHDPGMNIEDNKKHKKGIISIVANLPILPIVTSFLYYYNLPVPDGYPQKLPETAQTGNISLKLEPKYRVSNGYRYPIEWVSSQEQEQEKESGTEDKDIASGKPDNYNDGTYGIQIEELVFLLISQFGVEVDSPEKKGKAFAIAGQILKLAKDYPEAVVAIKRAQGWVPAGGEFVGAVRLELKRRKDSWRQVDWDAVKEERDNFDKLLEHKFPGMLDEIIKKIGGGQIGKE